MRCLHSSLLVAIAALAACGPGPQNSDEVSGWGRVPLGSVPMPGAAKDVIVVGDEFVMGGYARSGLILLASQDGVAWEDRSNKVEGGDKGTALVGMASAPFASVALVEVGPSASRSMGIRFAADARQWKEVDTERFARTTGVRAADVVWTGQEFFAVGGRPSGGDDPTVEALVYRSIDGLTWSLERSPLIRLDGARAPVQVTSWQGHLTVLATSATGGEAVVLVRGDEPGDWKVVEPPGLTDASVRALAATSAGLLYGGCTVDATGGREAAIWVDSAGTGESLTRVAVDGSSGCVSGISSGADQILAMGSDGDRAAVWSSADGNVWHRQQPADAFSGRIGAKALSAAQLRNIWVLRFGGGPPLVHSWAGLVAALD